MGFNQQPIDKGSHSGVSRNTLSRNIETILAQQISHFFGIDEGPDQADRCAAKGMTFRRVVDLGKGEDYFMNDVLLLKVIFKPNAFNPKATEYELWVPTQKRVHQVAGVVEKAATD